MLHSLRLRSSLAGPCALGLLLLAGSCRGPAPLPDTELQASADALALEDPETAFEQAEAAIFALPRSARSGAWWRYHAEALAAQAHCLAALGTPFWTEGVPPGAAPEGIGTRPPADGKVRRPSAVAHLVASIHHAHQAREHFDRALRVVERTRKDPARFPPTIAAIDLHDLDARLQVLTTVAYAQLGFREEVSAVLARSPELLQRETCFPALDRYGVPDAVRPWVCEMIFTYLRNEDEVRAYRFGVLAVEGQERFGHALSRKAIDRVEHWIVHESKYLFVCPESQTAYLPGERRSPISGVPHIDYVPVDRPSGQRP